MSQSVITHQRMELGWPTVKLGCVIYVYVDLKDLLSILM